MKGSERRLHPRTEVVATATVVTAKRYAGTYLVSNLSVGGALLRGDALLKTGDEVRILLELPSARLVRLAARVLRHMDGRDGHLFAVAFHDVPPETQQLLQDVVAMALARSERQLAHSTVLLFTRDAAARSRLESELRDVGMHTSSCGAPLSALVVLNGSRPVDVAIVDLGLEEGIGADFLAFLAEAYPHVRRVALMAPGDPRHGRWEATATLARPWSDSQLKQAVLPH